MKKLVLLTALIAGHIGLIAQTHVFELNNTSGGCSPFRSYPEGSELKVSHGAPEFVANDVIKVKSISGYENDKNYVKGDGMILGFGFIKGETYTVSVTYKAETEDNDILGPPDAFKIFAASGLKVINDEDEGEEEHCEQEKAASADSKQAIATEHFNYEPSNTRTYTFTANKDYKQLWMYTDDPAAAIPGFYKDLEEPIERAVKILRITVNGKNGNLVKSMIKFEGQNVDEANICSNDYSDFKITFSHRKGANDDAVQTTRILIRYISDSNGPQAWHITEAVKNRPSDYTITLKDVENMFPWVKFHPNQTYELAYDAKAYNYKITDVMTLRFGEMKIGAQMKKNYGTQYKSTPTGTYKFHNYHVDVTPILDGSSSIGGTHYGVYVQEFNLSTGKLVGPEYHSGWTYGNPCVSVPSNINVNSIVPGGMALNKYYKVKLVLRSHWQQKEFFVSRKSTKATSTGHLFPIRPFGAEADLTFNVYPNPAQYEINITTEEGVELIQIMDLQGKMVANEVVNTEGTKTIDIAHLQRGMYIIRCVKDNGESQTQRFVKQ